MNRILQCEEYGLDEINQLMEGLQEAGIRDVLNTNIPELDRVLAVERLGFLDGASSRSLAIRSCRRSYDVLKDELTPAEQQLVEAGLYSLDLHYNNFGSFDDLREVRQKIQVYVNDMDKGNYEKVKRSIGMLEMILAACKGRSDGALREVNSIQRDIIGPGVISDQLADIHAAAGVHSGVSQY